MIGSRKLQPLARRIADVRNQPSSRSARVGSDAEDRKQRQGNTEEPETPALKADLLMLGVVDDARRRDRPARILGTATFRCNRTGRVNRILERNDLSRP